jgi:hypothetical protein
VRLGVEAQAREQAMTEEQRRAARMAPMVVAEGAQIHHAVCPATTQLPSGTALRPC